MFDYIEDGLPSMKGLNRYVVHKYASNWKDIALELDLSEPEIAIIEKDNQECVDCFRKTLQKWLDSATLHATWKSLEVAITNAKRAQLCLDPVTDIYGKCNAEWYIDSIMLSNIAS